MSNCAPFTPCEPAQPAQPVLPRCQNISLPAGVFTNATVGVGADGCIVSVEQGAPPLYTPDPCCGIPGGTGVGAAGPQGPAGEPGAAATVTLGTVATLTPGSDVVVTNTGTPQHAILNFAIPQGDTGEDAPIPAGLSGNHGGMVLEDGIVQQLPVLWPPIYRLRASGVPAGVAVNIALGADDHYLIEVDISAYDMQLRNAFQSLIDDLQAQVDAVPRLFGGKGPTSARPVGVAGMLYLDTTLDPDGRPIWWTGVAWVNSTGVVV